MYWYALNKASATLFVHFDKNIYTNRETAWFTGYLVKDGTKSTANVLSAALVRTIDRSVLAQGKFVMNGGLSQGSLYLPDSLPTGDYNFVCYTDGFVNGQPTDIFVQPVTIKTVNDESFVATLTIMDSLKPGTDSLRIRLRALTYNGNLVEGAAVRHVIGNRDRPFKSGTGKTDKYGELFISIPVKQIDATNNQFQAEIRHGREVQSFSLQLPVYKKAATVTFYPEGGNLVAGLKSSIGWEVTTNGGMPLQITGHLYQDDKEISTIKTGENGIGRFTLTPAAKAVYRVKLQSVEYGDTAYTLPTPAMEGPVVAIEKALASDTLHISVSNKQRGTKWTGLIHNYKSILLTAPITANGDKIWVKVPLADVPKGLYSFTLLDSLQRPWAERIFFAHYAEKPVLTISADSATYGTRRKADVKPKVTDAQGKPLSAMLSIACVSDSRFDRKKMTDIESYVYLVHELSQLPLSRGTITTPEETTNRLENLLLVKGWRRYKWGELAGVEAKDTTQAATNILFTGKAYIPRKAMKAPVVITMIKESHPVYFGTDSSGNFTIPPADMIVKPGQYIRFVVKGDEQSKYLINVTDFYTEWNKKLAPVVPFPNYAPFLSGQTSQVALLDRKQRVKELPVVTVMARKNPPLYANSCGDYVCVANVLNCPRHPTGGTDPIVGVVYNTGRGKKIYEGCEGMIYLSKITGIATPKEFYTPAYNSEESLAKRDLASTIYWNHSLLTDRNGEARFSFSTNDLTGRFRIVVQGVTGDAGVVFGEQFFEVKDKE